MDWERLINTGLSKGLEGIEIYLLESEETSIAISNDKVKEAFSSNSISMGVRGTIGKKTGIVSINDVTLSEDIIVDRLLSIVKASMEDPHWSGFPPPASGFKTTLCRDEKIITMDYEEKLSVIKDLISVVKDEALRNGAERALVAEGVFRFGIQKITVVSSEGVFKHDECTLIDAYLVAKSMMPEGESDKSFWIANRRFDYRELEGLGAETGRLSTMFSRSVRIDDGEYELIITPPVANAITSYALVPAFSALNVVEGRSPLKGKIGKSVFSENITIIDDPTIPLEIGSRVFDDEGLPTSTKFLVENGVVKTLLHNYYTFKRVGNGVYGNGFRRSPSAPPSPSPTNLVLKPGNTSLDELIMEVDKGIIVYETIGYWMSNPYNGDVKATATHALVVRKGEVTGSAKGILVTGNIYQWLGSLLKGLSRETFASAGVITPGLWVEKVRIASE
ncbi:MAG: TldD/PmbA family protein [Thermosphaera sp.]